MKRRYFLSVLSFVTCMAMLFTSLTFTNVFTVFAVEAVEAEEKEAWFAEIPAGNDSGFKAHTAYGHHSLDIYTEAEAAEAGVPAGYSGYVLSMVGSATNAAGSFTMDLSTWQVQAADVESMTIRMWVNEGTKSVRISSSVTQWILNQAPAAIGQWFDLTLTPTTFAHFTNADGTLGAFELAFRMTSGAPNIFVDSVTLQMANAPDEPETEKPTEPDPEPDAPAHKAELPVGNDSGFVAATRYGGTTVVYSESEAAEAGVPEGYEGYVLKLTSSSNGAASIPVDLTAWGVQAADAESVVIRLWVGEGTKSVRLCDASGWFINQAPTAIGQWFELTLTPDNMTHFTNADGTLGAFELAFRMNDGTPATLAYVDCVTANLKVNDGVGPAIQYKGETTINTSAGKPFAVDGMTAYDEQDEAYVEPVYRWSEGAFDENGLLMEGDHTCEVSFTDLFGNVSKVTLQLHVAEKESEPPVIHFGLSTIHAVAGTYACLENTIRITDNYDLVTPVLTWSEGALDQYNRLQAGTHTLTVTATDLTGNSSEKTVTFIVSDQADAPGQPSL